MGKNNSRGKVPQRPKRYGRGVLGARQADVRLALGHGRPMVSGGHLQRAERGHDTYCFGKAVYPDQPAAVHAAHLLNSSVNRRNVEPLRAYQCPGRPHWHLTSKPPA